MKLIFISGPFRSINHNGKSNAWGVQCNVMTAMALALEVWKLGHVAVCPHANSMFFQDADGVEDKIWLDGYLELLKKCDALITTNNWMASSGTRAEVGCARHNNIPAFHSLDELKAWLSQNP
jgi:hypothetical protein